MAQHHCQSSSEWRAPAGRTPPSRCNGRLTSAKQTPGSGRLAGRPCFFSSSAVVHAVRRGSNLIAFILITFWKYFLWQSSTMRSRNLKNTRKWTKCIFLQGSSCQLREATCLWAASQPATAGYPSVPSQSLVWGQTSAVAVGYWSRPSQVWDWADLERSFSSPISLSQLGSVPLLASLSQAMLSWTTFPIRLLFSRLTTGLIKLRGNKILRQFTVRHQLGIERRVP